jgi:anti-sigma regulatory factor (Ser/Thr protein kinase)
VTHAMQVSRAAAQLHEAAQEVARLAARRKGGPGLRLSGPRGDGIHQRGVPGQSLAPAPVPPAPTNQEQAMSSHWPLRSFLELAAVPGAVPCARLHARQVAWEWGQAGLGGDTELLVSELMTNAVAAARTMEPVSITRLWLLSDTSQIAVLVWDASPRPPSRTQVEDEDESGRGLLLVEAISQRWGWYPAKETTGKVVWALTGMSDA